MVMVCVILEYILMESVKNAMAFRGWWSDFRGYWPIEPLPTSVGRNPDQWRHQRSVCMSNTTNHRQTNYGMDGFEHKGVF